MLFSLPSSSWLLKLPINLKTTVNRRPRNTAEMCYFLHSETTYFLPQKPDKGFCFYVYIPSVKGNSSFLKLEKTTLLCTTRCKNTRDNVPYLAVNEVLKIFRFSFPLPPLSKLLAMQDHDQNLNKQP